jgi:hypothetical protein
MNLGPVPKNVSPLSQAELEWIERVRAAVNGSDKYKPGDFVGRLLAGESVCGSIDPDQPSLNLKILLRLKL